MTGDRMVLTFAAIGMCVLLAWDAAGERDRRIAAEERLQQVERAAQTPCQSRPGHRLISTVNVDSDGALARWCGHYRTVMESVRVEWERAK
jgi:hypothetical protein